jgi:peptidoglycan hydrolase-like protein with peptidoglycan-binding domain
MLHTIKTNMKFFAPLVGPEGSDQSQSILEQATRDKLKAENVLFVAQEANVTAFIESLPKRDGKIDTANLTSAQKEDIALIDWFLKVANNESITTQQESIRAKRGVVEQTRQQVAQIPMDAAAAKKTAEGKPARTAPATTASIQDRSENQISSTLLKRGDKSDSVKVIQKALGMSEAEIASWEGNFWPKTEKLVRDYQKANNLDVDWIAGADTLKKLRVSPLTPTLEARTTLLRDGTPTPPSRPRGIATEGRPEKLTTPQARAQRGEIKNPRTAEFDATVRRSSGAPLDITSDTQRGVQARPNTVRNGMTAQGQEVIADLESINRFLDAHNRTYGQRGEMISNRNGIVGIVWQLSNPDSRRLATELGMSEEHIKAYAGSLWLDNSKVTDGIIRMAVTAAVSLLLSGGASVALELFWINISRDYKSGPGMSKILAAMGRNWDIDTKRRNVLMNPRTTSGDLEGQAQVLRKENMLPANLKKAVRDITSTGFFLTDFLADLFGGQEKRQVEGLIKQFEQAQNLDEAEAILTDICALLTDAHYKKYGRWDVNSTIDDLSKVLSSIRQLKAKNDKIKGKGFDNARYNRDASIIQNVLDSEYGKPNKKINVKGQSYAPALPRNLNPNTLHTVAQMMVDTKVNNDKYSILTNVMRWVNLHYGISFTPQEFVDAFTSMRWMSQWERLEFNKKILSNTGRQKNETFNGLNSNAGVAVMELNGRKIYFKDACTNVLTVVNDIPTVIESATSFPVAIPVGTGGILSPKSTPQTWESIWSQPGDTSTIITWRGTTGPVTWPVTGGTTLPVNPLGL